MGLADVQTALAKLFTDENLRNRFFDDPLSVGRSLGLDDSEAAGLTGLSELHVTQFARSLRRKRVDDARKVLPLTSRALGDSFAPLLLGVLDGPLPRDRHRDDARMLAMNLERLARNGTLDPPWAADLARYELTFTEIRKQRSVIIARRFRFPVGLLADAINRGEPIPQARPGCTVGLWLRIPGRRGVIHRVLFS